MNKLGFYRKGVSGWLRVGKNSMVKPLKLRVFWKKSDDGAHKEKEMGTGKWLSQ